MCDNYTKESEYDNTRVKIISIPSFNSNNKKYGETYKHTKKYDSYKILFGRKKLETKQK